MKTFQEDHQKQSVCCWYTQQHCCFFFNLCFQFSHLQYITSHLFLFLTILENCLEEKEAPLLLPLLLLLCCKCFSLTRDFKLQSIEPLDPDRRCQHLPKGDATFCLYLKPSTKTFLPPWVIQRELIPRTQTSIQQASKRLQALKEHGSIHIHIQAPDAEKSKCTCKKTKKQKKTTTTTK